MLLKHSQYSDLTMSLFSQVKTKTKWTHAMIQQLVELLFTLSVSLISVDDFWPALLYIIALAQGCPILFIKGHLHVLTVSLLQHT